MDHHCLEPLELTALLALPTTDERRRDAAACPRCDSLLRAMVAFLDGDAAVPNAEKLHAERHLAGLLAGTWTARTEQSAATPTSGGERRVASRSRRGRGWGLGLGLAAAAAGVMLMVARGPLAPSGPSGVLRGGAPTSPAAGEPAVTVTTGERNGQMILTWPGVAGADHYLVELFSAELDTLAVYGPLSEPTLAVETASLRRGADTHAAAGGVLCRVRALAGNGVLAVSRLTVLKLP